MSLKFLDVSPVCQYNIVQMQRLSIDAVKRKKVHYEKLKHSVQTDVPLGGCATITNMLDSGLAIILFISLFPMTFLDSKGKL